jgi:hypothetical protein
MRVVPVDFDRWSFSGLGGKLKFATYGDPWD